jgi:hypothetical protein
MTAMMTRDGVAIGREFLLDQPSAECCLCGRRMYRGWRVRAVIGRGAAHRDCARPDHALLVFQTLFQISPAQPVDIHRRIETSGCTRHWIAATLLAVYEAGLIRRAGRYYRPSRDYPTPEALFLAWVEIRPRIGRKPRAGDNPEDGEPSAAEAETTRAAG